MQASVKQLLEVDINRMRPLVAVAVVMAALLLQVFLPLLHSYANLVDLPLLITIYLALLRRNPLAGLSIGAAIGLVQDGLSHQPVGLFGIIKTLIGYFSSSLTTVIEVESLTARVVLVCGFYLVHQFSFWTMQRFLLVQQADFAGTRTLLLALVNGLVALLLYRLLDRFREKT